MNEQWMVDFCKEIKHHNPDMWAGVNDLVRTLTRHYTAREMAQDALIRERLRVAEESVNPDMTNAQYHAQLDKLWDAITPTETAYDSVFDAVVAVIQDLKAEVKRLNGQLGTETKHE